MYCELHCHSYYSLLDAASSPEALVDRAATLGMPCLAITDHNGLYGAGAFGRACVARTAPSRGGPACPSPSVPVRSRLPPVRPIIGAELTLLHGSHLTLLAETQAGYANLSRLISIGQLAGSKGKPRLAIEDVARHAGGLLCLTGCRQGAVAAAVLDGDAARARRAAGRLADIFGRDRTWVEVQRHWLPDDARLSAGLVAAAQGAGLPVVATNDVHYATPEGHRLRDVLTATRLNCSLDELSSRVTGPRLPAAAARPAGLAPASASAEFYLKGEAEMAALFADLPQAIRETQVIAERCTTIRPDRPDPSPSTGSPVSLDFSQRRTQPACVRTPQTCVRTPAFPPQTADFAAGLPAGETPFSYLYRLSHAGLVEKYRPVTPAALRQLSHELTVIENAGLADYFLIVWDIVRFARSQNIRCQGRGSAASSVVAYVLDITSVDPLEHNLLFERFLSDPGKHAEGARRSPSTQDGDPQSHHHMPDIDLDFESDRRDEVVAYIYERYGVEHAAMVCNVNTYQWRSAVRDVARALGFQPEDVDRIARWARENGPSTTVKEEGKRKKEDPSSFCEGALVLELAAQLIGTPRHLSVHVGGMLITAQPLVEVVPLERATKEGIVVAQWNKDSVEDAGLIKIDLLCLRTLDAISEACALIAQHHGPAPNLDHLPLDDPAVYRLLAEGDTIGAFQVESRAQAQMLPRLKPVRFEDLIVQVSIVRPGPIQGGMVHPYLRRRQGLEPVTYLHPSLEPVLRETLGVIIFQEQVLRVAMALAGFTPGEADLLRRAMSRSRSAEAMAALQERFLAGAVANGVEPAVAEEIFRQLQGFATYGFCKSHAASFALIAYQTLWLKAHYPLEYTCALLNHQPMGFYAPEVVMGDAQRHGITILRPHVNLSEDACTIEGTGNGPPDVAALRRMLRLGLRYLHGLGEAGRSRILAARSPAGSPDRSQPFTSLADFCRRTRLPRALIGDLIRAGALDGLDTPAVGALPGQERRDVACYVSTERGTQVRPQRRRMLWLLGGIQYEEEQLVETPDIEAELPPLSEAEAMAWDYELMGLSPGDHPMRLARLALRGPLRPVLRGPQRPALKSLRLQGQGVLSAAELAQRPAGQLAAVAGLVIVRQAPPTAKGHLFITLEDETGLANLIIRPDLYERKRAVLHQASALIVWGVTQRDGQASSLLVRDVQALDNGT